MCEECTMHTTLGNFHSQLNPVQANVIHHVLDGIVVRTLHTGILLHVGSE